MTIYEDEIIEELWEQREAYAAEHNHDLHAIVIDLMERQKERCEESAGNH